MKISFLLLAIAGILLFNACGAPERDSEANADMVGTVDINYDENFKSVFEPIKASDLDFSLMENEIDTSAEETAGLERLVVTESMDELTDSQMSNCIDNRPKTIRDLTDGVLIDAYSFEKGDESKLGLFGFANIKLTGKQKVLMIEYSQEGTQYCNDQARKYGVGARLMMKVTKSKRNAKLETPQQITASVIFGMAEVTYSLKTFGITGPGVGRLNKTGTLSEDTYQQFIQEVSNLIVEMYKEDSEFIVVPQPLPLKNSVQH